MTVFAHVGGVPLEEFAPAAAGASAALLMARGWLVARMRRRRRQGR